MLDNFVADDQAQFNTIILFLLEKSIALVEVADQLVNLVLIAA